MENTFQDMERDLILQTIIEEPSKLLISSLSEEFGTISLDVDQYSFIKKDLIFIKNINNPFPDNLPVKVFFYYKGIGVFFLTIFKYTSKGFALVIPPVFYKQKDVIESNKNTIKTIIYFITGPKTSVQINAFPLESFSLYDKNIYENLSKDKGITEPEKLKTVSCFFSESHNSVKAVKDRVEPFSLLFLSHEQIVFGAAEKDMILQIGIEYGLQIEIPMTVGKRIIFSTFKVKKIFEDTQDSFDIRKSCALCDFTQIKEEDKRFLCEKIFGK